MYKNFCYPDILILYLNVYYKYMCCWTNIIQKIKKSGIKTVIRHLNKKDM